MTGNAKSAHRLDAQSDCTQRSENDDLCRSTCTREAAVGDATATLYPADIRYPLHADAVVDLERCICRALNVGPATTDFNDALTGLINRSAFADLLSNEMQNENSDHDRLHLIVIDIDNFQIVNDVYGRQAGDSILVKVAACVRSVVGANAVLARSDGDEFSVLLSVASGEEASILADRIRLAVQSLVLGWNSEKINISASIGLVRILDFNSAHDALIAGDLACSVAKDKGFNRVQIQHSGDSELARKLDEMAWVQRIRNALARQRLCLFAQDIRRLSVDATGAHHVELLLRLIAEDGKIIPPGYFLPAAERYGLMPLLDRWVVSNALKIIGSRSKAPQLRNITSYAINLSGVTLGNDSFVDFVREEFVANNVAPELLCFEITETSAVKNIDAAKNFVAALKTFGCRFSLDDFGTGMSSYAYLKNLPVDYIKIDGSFVKEILKSKIDRTMVEMIVKMASVMGIAVIAEWVENESVLNALIEMNVDFAQGYFIGRPEPFTVNDDETIPALSNRGVGSVKSTQAA